MLLILEGEEEMIFKRKRKKKKLKTYLAGPIGDVKIEEAKDWREYLRVELAKIGIGVLNPLDKYGASLPKVRSQIKNWTRYGNIKALRHMVASKIIPQDLQMVKEADFITLWLPAERKAEVCGSYGEITVAFDLGIPVYIVTERKLKPLNVPKWAVGCSTEIFISWKDYLTHIKENWTNGKR